MKLSVFCGVSVDGFRARPDDALGFLHTGEQEPHGFKEFLASVDVVVIGRRTFDVVLKLGHLALYGKKPLVALSGRPLDFSSAKDGVVEQMSGEPGEIATRLEARGLITYVVVVWNRTRMTRHSDCKGRGVDFINGQRSSRAAGHEEKAFLKESTEGSEDAPSIARPGYRQSCRSQ
jgi:hypothetical protein